MSLLSRIAAPRKAVTGHHVLAAMLVFFAVIVAVNMGMAVLASRTWTGLVVENSYVASQQFNAGLASAREQAARGWVGDISYDGKSLSVSVADRAGRAVQLDNVVARVGRPAFEQADHVLHLTSSDGTIYMANDVLAPGVWQVSVRASNAEGGYRLDKRITVKRGETP